MTREHLGFVTHSFDFGGVQTVTVAVRRGAYTYFDLSKNDVKALKWHEIPNMARTVPDIDGLADGLCHLFLKARNKRGQESNVTDVPFVLDRQPLQAAAEMDSSNDPLSNGSVLRVT